MFLSHFLLICHISFKQVRHNTQRSGFFCFSGAGCGKPSWPGHCGPSVIGGCGWAGQVRAYRHWVSSRRSKLLRLRLQALPAHRQFSTQVTRRERGHKMRYLRFTLKFTIDVMVRLWQWRVSYMSNSASLATIKRWIVAFVANVVCDHLCGCVKTQIATSQVMWERPVFSGLY